MGDDQLLSNVELFFGIVLILLEEDRSLFGVVEDHRELNLLAQVVGMRLISPKSVSCLFLSSPYGDYGYVCVFVFFFSCCPTEVVVTLPEAV